VLTNAWILETSRTEYFVAITAGKKSVAAVIIKFDLALDTLHHPFIAVLLAIQVIARTAHAAIFRQTAAPAAHLLIIVAPFNALGSHALFKVRRRFKTIALVACFALLLAFWEASTSSLLSHFSPDNSLA
jgi:hypothetical protein